MSIWTGFQGLGSTDFWAALDVDYQTLGKGPLPETFGPDLDAATQARIDRELAEIKGIKQLLAAHDGPRAVASSSRLHRLTHKLQHTGLFPYFEPHIYSGEQVTNGKPAPDLFLFAADKLGVDPKAALVVEDSVNGVKAGLAAGMTVGVLSAEVIVTMATRNSCLAPVHIGSSTATTTWPRC